LKKVQDKRNDTHAMKPKSFEGILLRFADSGTDMVFVIEPDDEAVQIEVRSEVTEILCRQVAAEHWPHADLVRNLGERIGFTVKPTQRGREVEIEGDWFPAISVSCSDLSATERDYEVDDLRQKALLLATRLQSFQELAGESCRREQMLRAKIAHFLADRRGRWEARRDFFAATKPDRARHFAERLEVLSELESLLREENSQAATSDGRPATPEDQGEGPAQS
jgi:hypothetical protein